MIYTCYEMIRDCGAGRPEGWSYFLTQYVPVIRGLLAHYYPEREGDRALVERVLVRLRQPGSSLFQSLEPAPERAFVAGLRQHVLRAVEADRASAAPDVAIEIEALGAALEPFTLTEKQVAWFARNGGEDPRARRRVGSQRRGCVAQHAACRQRCAAGPSCRRTIHEGLRGGQSLLRCDRRARHLARPRGNGAPRERLLALPGSLLPPAGSGGRAARLEAAA